MNDELTDETMFELLSVSRQQELIDTYCEQLIERIERSDSREAARRIVDEQCSAFDSKCFSAVLRTAVRDHAQKKLSERWGKE